MIKLTLDQFGAQWDRGKNKRSMGSLLAFNAENFATRAGEYARLCFISSFASGGFYGSAKRWAPRRSEWGRKYHHPILIDTGTLKGKIVGKKSSRDSGKLNSRDFHRKYKYEIDTNELGSPIKGKRGGGYRTYAAVHNTDPKFGLYTVNQYSKRRPEHRQFIGFNDKINYVINTFFVPDIFNGFPK